MQTLIIQAFLCQDQMGAQVSLAQASTIEQMIRETMSLMPMRLLKLVWNHHDIYNEFSIENEDILLI